MSHHCTTFDFDGKVCATLLAMAVATSMHRAVAWTLYTVLVNRL